METFASNRFWLKNYPANIPTNFEFERLTLPQALKRSALKYKDKEALYFLHQPITYGDLYNRVQSFAAALLEEGIKPGDKVALMLPNIPQFVIAHYAVLQIGAVAVLVNPLYTEPELEYLLNDSGAESLILPDSIYPRAKSIRDRTLLKRIIVCHINDCIPIDKEKLPPGSYFPIENEPILLFRDLQIKCSNHNIVEDQSNWDSLALLIYTGGTTGVSKGVMLNHSNLSCATQQTLAYNKGILVEGKTLLLAIYPFFHVAGYTVVQNASLWNGTSMVLIPRPEVKGIIELINKYRPDVLQAVPTLFVGLLQEEDFLKMDTSFIKAFGTGAAPMSAATFQSLRKFNADAFITEGYGMTETAGLIANSPAIHQYKPSTVGMPVTETEVKVVDIETGTQELNQGESGEIIVKGPQVMQGYYKKPEATEEALRNGWLYTGDIGYMDEEGWIFIIDRKKDMIIAGGYKVYPKEVDEVLFSHPNILEACTVGVPDEYRGETVKAFIVKKPNVKLDENDIFAYCKERLAAYKVPKMIEFLSSLPKSNIGKILRRELRK